MKRIFVGIILIFVFSGVIYVSRHYTAVSPEVRKAFIEADSKFTYHGKSIHPELIEKFESWMSDSEVPTVVSVDLISAEKNGNEYGRENLSKDGISYKRGVVDGSYAGFYRYQWLGRLKNGLHVVRVADCGGGSGVFETLDFIKFSLGEGVDKDGKRYDRLLMTIVRQHFLGDRYDGEVTVFADKVVIGKGERIAADPMPETVLKF